MKKGLLIVIAALLILVMAVGCTQQAAAPAADNKTEDKAAAPAAIRTLIPTADSTLLTFLLHLLISFSNPSFMKLPILFDTARRYRPDSYLSKSPFKPNLWPCRYHCAYTVRRSGSA